VINTVSLVVKEAHLSAIDSQTLFNELSGSEDVGFATIHSPVHSSPARYHTCKRLG